MKLLPSSPRFKTLNKLFATGAVMALVGCAPAPGPSVPFQQGKSLDDAKAAFEICAPQGPIGARQNLTASYWFSPLWGGIIIGPLTIAATAEQIRENGARNAVDKCLADQGYSRRTLSAEEIKFLNESDAYVRELFLDHLIAGGSLVAFEQDTFAE
ncbi:hypothetical protein GFB49_02925 [Epibacterium sp. SM1979]|uniref:Lipoprotein n=1 Tax=Tritonibacter litoralis TaxID=2662264 RepID=A0A843YBZ0_9RHOB|nr:hypothetical protein [Tritonibacter litoralis]MQQ07398.1 hypothetical protein [Tritonibacter litoralis]